MTDNKKTIGPDVGTPTEAPEQPSPAPNLADTTAPAPLGPEELTVRQPQHKLLAVPSLCLRQTLLTGGFYGNFQKCENTG